MKNTVLNLSMAALLALSVSARAEENTPNCGEESKQASKAVTAAPDDVLKIVAEKVAAAPACSCEIVKAAIKASKADTDLVVLIVTTAVEAAPEESANIINCAMDVSPDSARAIADKFGSGKGVVAAEPSGKEPVSTGKEPTGKQPVDKGGAPVEPDDDHWDFGRFHAGIGGIYLTPPSSGLSNGGFIPRPTTPSGQTNNTNVSGVANTTIVNGATRVSGATLSLGQ
jgi:hypothetical protein